MWECSTTARSPTSRMADREEVERSIEVGLAQGKVGRGDCGDEAVVEGSRDPEPAVNAVPAEPQRELVRTQLARVEEAQDDDLGEARLEQSPVLVEPVLAHVPGVVG